MWKCIVVLFCLAILHRHASIAESDFDFVNGMGNIVTDTLPLDASILQTGLIASFLGLPEQSIQRHESDLDDAPEVLQESAGASAKNGTNAAKPKAAKPKAESKKAQLDKLKRERARKRKEERRQEAKELKAKNAMPPPPRQAGTPHIRLGKVEFSTDRINSKTLHATLSLSGRNIRGRTLHVGGDTFIKGALHLRGSGSLLKSKVTQKNLRATVFVNKQNVKSCGIAVSNEGGFFDHNDGYITYEPLDGSKGFKVNAPMTTTGKLYADGTLHLGGSGSARKSKITQRTVYTLLHTNRHMAIGGGFAVSDTGGFFDFKDGFITYEPLAKANGLLVNSKFSVQQNAHFKKDVHVKGTLNVDGDINVGGVKMLSFGKSFSGFDKKHNALEDRVQELETQNSRLLQRLEQMEQMMMQMQKA